MLMKPVVGDASCKKEVPIKSRNCRCRTDYIDNRNVDFISLFVKTGRSRVIRSIGAKAWERVFTMGKGVKAI